jgi:hypothetical protein
MSRAHRTAGVHDDAVIAFLLFCLEIYQAEKNVSERCIKKIALKTTRTAASGSTASAVSPKANPWCGNRASAYSSTGQGGGKQPIVMVAASCRTK